MFFGDKGIVGARILYRTAVTAGVPIAAFGCPGTQVAYCSLRIISNEPIIGIK